MKTIIAGSRSIEDVVFKLIENAVDNGFSVTEVVSETAEGVDKIGEKWAEENNKSIAKFPYEDYLKDNTANVAPLVRNKEMAEYSDQAIIVWDGSSSGTKNMIEEAKDKNLNLHINRTDNTDITDFYTE